MNMVTDFVNGWPSVMQGIREERSVEIERFLFHIYMVFQNISLAIFDGGDFVVVVLLDY
jgi:hypothetical protein